MKLLTGEQMKEYDRIAIEDYAIPSQVLMEDAGHNIAEVMGEAIDELESAHVVVVSGKGNNGGDGLVAARHLIEMGISVATFLLGDPEKSSEETKRQIEILESSGHEITYLNEQEEFDKLHEAIGDADVVVDALLGIGVKGAVRSPMDSFIKWINESTALIVSVDMPSGVDADNGKEYGPCVQADLTITIEYPKLGLLLEPGGSSAGDVIVTQIVYPDELRDSFESGMTLVEEDAVLDWLPLRDPRGHKGSNGKVLLIAGSKGMSGAAILSAEAALRSGAGLVYMGFPESLSQVIESSVFEAVKIPLPENDGALALTSLDDIEAAIEEHQIDVVAIGPGLSLSSEIEDLLHQLLPKLNVPVVIDADGLNALANDEGMKLLKKLKIPVVLTPHPGELSRFNGLEISEIEAARVEIAEQTARDLDVTLVLKGVPTVIATSAGEIFINSSGNSGLATGGSGDVLTGLIAGLIGQGMEVEKAAAAGVFIHGLIADRLQPELGERAMLPRDLLAKMPEVMREFE